MDANSIDHGADEAVQRIKNSLSNIERPKEPAAGTASADVDHGADEAVGRIQGSLQRISNRSEAHKEAKNNPDALHGILEELTTSAHAHMQSSETYKKLASKDSVTGVLHEAVLEMIAIASTTADVLREHHDLHVDREGYKLLKNAVTRYEEISEAAKQEGDPSWSSRGIWEIERALRGKEVPTEEVPVPDEA